MHCRRAIRAVAQAVALLTAISGAQAFDDTKYPNLKGQWTRASAPGAEPSFDPSKPPGRAQQAPLTPEYQAVFEANMRERERPAFRAHGRDRRACRPACRRP